MLKIIHAADFHLDSPFSGLTPAGAVQRRREQRQLLERLRQATAVFAVSDFYALDLMCFLAEHGLAVPGDISIAGFDDTPMCELVRPALTTVRQDAALRARLAVEKLRELREGKPVQPEYVLPVSLVVRGSTGPCRLADCTNR